MSLAWDGTNLYVSDAYNRRVQRCVLDRRSRDSLLRVFRNAASLDISWRAPNRDGRGYDPRPATSSH